MKKIDGIIFDMDGVIIDVSQSYRDAIRQTASFFLKRKVSTQEVDEIKNKVGMNNDWDATYALINNQTAPYESVKQYFQLLYLGKDGRRGLRDRERLLIPRAKLVQLKKKYGTLAIATGRPRDEAQHVLKRFSLAGVFDCLVAMEDVANGKPASDVLLVVVNRLNLKNPVYIGDSPSDVVAAERVGIPCLYIGDENLGIKRFSSTLQVIDYLL